MDRATGVVSEREHACPARLPHRRRHHCRRSLLVRVEELLWDFELAELIVPSKDFVVLQFLGEREPRILMSGVVLCVWDGKRCIDV